MSLLTSLAHMSSNTSSTVRDVFQRSSQNCQWREEQREFECEMEIILVLVRGEFTSVTLTSWSIGSISWVSSWLTIPWNKDLLDAPPMIYRISFKGSFSRCSHGWYFFASKSGSFSPPIDESVSRAPRFTSQTLQRINRMKTVCSVFSDRDYYSTLPTRAATRLVVL
jgi:hypothetical protein